jgi:hypothetical protein
VHLQLTGQEEVDNLKDVNHQNLVQFFGLDSYLESDVITLHLIMEHVGGGSLRTKIAQFGCLSAEVCCCA